MALAFDNEAQRKAFNRPDFQSRICAELQRCGIDATRATESEIKKAWVSISVEKEGE